MALECQAHTWPLRAIESRREREWGGSTWGGRPFPDPPGLVSPRGRHSRRSLPWAWKPRAQARCSRPGAGLGGSSKYSNEYFEGWSGEEFHVNSNLIVAYIVEILKTLVIIEDIKFHKVLHVRLQTSSKWHIVNNKAFDYVSPVTVLK